jgi:phosphatidylglycerol---prolipoprotein diacylglyceryl transferase
VRLRYTLGIVPIAVVTFQFDPYAHPFDVAILWGTIALIAVFVATLVSAGVLARADDLRADDVLFIAIGTVPGAVVGGRIGYLLLHLDTFGSDPLRLLDPSVGGLELGLAVVGGTLTGAYVASLLDAPVGRWLHLAALPILFALGAGKATMILTGAGQGQPSDAIWATAYLGPGPWASLAPAIPSTPSQALEGSATLVILVVLTAAVMVGGFGRRDGRLFLVGIGTWAVVRALVATTWRDPAEWTGFNAGVVAAVAIAVGCFLIALFMTLRRGRAGRPASGASEPPGSIVSTSITRSDP